MTSIFLQPRKPHNMPNFWGYVLVNPDRHVNIYFGLFLEILKVQPNLALLNLLYSLLAISSNTCNRFWGIARITNWGITFRKSVARFQNCLHSKIFGFFSARKTKEWVGILNFYSNSSSRFGYSFNATITLQVIVQNKRRMRVADVKKKKLYCVINL